MKITGTENCGWRDHTSLHLVVSLTPKTFPLLQLPVVIYKIYNFEVHLPSDQRSVNASHFR